jgi:hypothetical protein
MESHKASFTVYFFVSALTNDGVKLLFQEVARIADSSRLRTDNEQPQREVLGEGQGDWW